MRGLVPTTCSSAAAVRGLAQTTCSFRTAVRGRAHPHAALARGLSATRGCNSFRPCLEPLGSQRGQRARQIRGSGPWRPWSETLARYQWLPSGAEPYVVTPENCENPSDESTDTAAFSRGKVRTKTEQLGDGHKSSTFPANQGAREPAATPLDIPTLVGHTMRKVQRLNVGGRKLKI